MLVGVKLGHIDVDELHVRVLECRLAGGSEIAVACADADNQVGLVRDFLRRERPGRARRAQLQRMIVGEAALACHRLAHGNAEAIDKTV